MDYPRPAPWERQPGESPASFDSFLRYLQMGPERSIAQMERDDGRSYQHLAHEHRWTARADAWEREANAVRHEATMDQVAIASRRHLEQIEKAFQLSMLQFNRSLQATEEMIEAGDHGKLVEHSKLVKGLETIVKLHRLVLGASTENVAAAIDPSKLTQEELETYCALQAKASK